METLQQVIKYVNEAYQGKNIQHFVRVVYWFEQFLGRPLSEAEAIAAYSHDIERAFRGTAKSSIKSVENYTDESFLSYHQNHGAKIMAEFLQRKGFKDIETVKHLISKHEVGGDPIQNALMDADSVSFFETNVEKFATEKVEIEGYESVKTKLDWMFNRIKSDKAKSIAQPLHERWSKILLINSQEIN